MPDSDPSAKPQPQDPQPTPATPPSLEAQPGGSVETPTPQPQPASPPSPGLKGSGLRYPDDYPIEELRGKTADEAAQMFSTYRDAILTGMPTTPQPAPPSPAQPPSPQPTSMQPQPSGAPTPPSSDLMYSDPAEWQRQYDAYTRFQMQQTVQQASAPFLQSQAQMARSASRSDADLSDVWTDYGAEIDTLMASMPLEQRASPQIWNQAAEMVAGRHRRELAAKMAEKLAGRPPDSGTVPSEGYSPGDRSTPLDPIDKLFSEHPEVAERYRSSGIDAPKLRSHLRTMGRDPSSFVESVLKKETVHG